MIVMDFARGVVAQISRVPATYARPSGGESSVTHPVFRKEDASTAQTRAPARLPIKTNPSPTVAELGPTVRFTPRGSTSAVGKPSSRVTCPVAVSDVDACSVSRWHPDAPVGAVVGEVVHGNAFGGSAGKRDRGRDVARVRPVRMLGEEGVTIARAGHGCDDTRGSRARAEAADGGGRTSVREPGGPLHSRRRQPRFPPNGGNCGASESARGAPSRLTFADRRRTASASARARVSRAAPRTRPRTRVASARRAHGARRGARARVPTDPALPSRPRPSDALSVRSAGIVPAASVRSRRSRLRAREPIRCATARPPLPAASRRTR